MGQPVVPNGLPLSKIHHAAFDAHLIGIDPDYRLHVSGRLLDLHDGPMLEALKQLDGECSTFLQGQRTIRTVTGYRFVTNNLRLPLRLVTFLILQALFSRSETGLLTADSAPTMPGIGMSELMKKI